jgi:hypothetical protein
MYKIIRFYSDENKESQVIKTGLTLAEAQEHCNSELTHKKDSEGNIIYFDGYNKE